MPRILLAEPFSREAAPAEFDCGIEVWQRALSDWITTELVTESIQKRGTEVWLYYTEQGTLVGYGALGTTRRPWPPPNSSQYEKLSIIPAVAVKREFWGEPKSDPPRFSHQILGDLIYKAGQQGTRILIVDVHVDNARAIALYERFEFMRQTSQRDEYIQMARRLR